MKKSKHLARVLKMHPVTRVNDIRHDHTREEKADSVTDFIRKRISQAVFGHDQGTAQQLIETVGPEKMTSYAVAVLALDAADTCA